MACAALFETPPQATLLRQQFNQVPNPYVIEPPAMGQRQLEAGDPLVFHMVLVGADALRQLPLIVHAWQRALGHGLGKQRAPAVLEALSWVGEQGQIEPVLDAVTGQVVSHQAQLLVPMTPGQPGLPANAGAQGPSPSPSLSLHIDTPLRLQHQGQPLGPTQLDLRTLALAVVRRASLMLQIHAGLPVQPDMAALLETLAETTDDRSQLRWHDWTRYSSRQQQEMTLGGVIGAWELSGPATTVLWPWLWLGQWLHLGKNATMGMGRYDLRCSF